MCPVRSAAPPAITSLMRKMHCLEDPSAPRMYLCSSDKPSGLSVITTVNVPSLPCSTREALIRADSASSAAAVSSASADG
eukprot:scaffold4729_cov273-Pinguiococcus_pyrenoidosus.AAC.1